MLAAFVAGCFQRKPFRMFGAGREVPPGEPSQEQPTHRIIIMNRELLHVGLDVHAESIAVAIAEAGREGEVRNYGAVSGGMHAVERPLPRLGSAQGAEGLLRGGRTRRFRDKSLRKRARALAPRLWNQGRGEPKECVARHANVSITTEVTRVTLAGRSDSGVGGILRCIRFSGLLGRRDRPGAKSSRGSTEVSDLGYSFAPEKRASACSRAQ